MSNVQALANAIIAQGDGEISENEALALANQNPCNDRYLTVLEGTIDEWASEIVKDELANRQALRDWGFDDTQE